MTVKAWKQSLRGIRKYLEYPILEKHLLFPGILTALFSLGLWQIGAWQSLELLGFNLLFCTRNSLTHPRWDSRIAIIGIDDNTLHQYGQFPLSRDRYAQLLTNLEASPPAAIGFNILFPDQSSHDAEFAQAIAINGQVVLAIAPSLQKKVLRPVSVLDRVTAKGHIASNADLDGVTRQFWLYLDQIPSLSIMLVQAYNDSLQQTFTANTNNSTKSLISLPSLTPGATTQSVWINWIGPTQGDEGIPTYSLADVVQRKIDTAKLANKIVLVGLTATGINDPLKTPFEQTPPTSGVYLQAAVIDNLLNNRLLKRLTWQFEPLLLLSFGVICSLILAPLKFRQRTFLLGLMPITWFSLSVLALTISNFWLPIAAPIGTMLLAGLTVQWQEQREKQQLMSLFVRHVSQETAALIWRHRSEIFQNGQLDAKEMVATVVFTDIRDFTSISEQMTPQDLLKWLNCYLGAMTQCIQEHHGVVDKYIGDAIMAVFGIPFPHTSSEEIQQDAINAVSAAISMQKQLVLLNQKLEQQGMPIIRMGIGIHTGLVVAGSIGGSQRLNYSVLGDAVNIAARLEQLNKNTKADNPHNILVSEATFQLIKQNFHTQQILQLQLRGRQKSTMIYSILGSDFPPKVR